MNRWIDRQTDTWIVNYYLSPGWRGAPFAFFVIYWQFYKNRSVTTWVQIRKLNLLCVWFLQNSPFALPPAFLCGFILFFQSIKLESHASSLRSKVKFHTHFLNRIPQKAPWGQLLIRAVMFVSITWHWGGECTKHLQVQPGSYPKGKGSTWKWWAPRNRKGGEELVSC